MHRFTHILFGLFFLAFISCGENQATTQSDNPSPESKTEVTETTDETGTTEEAPTDTPLSTNRALARTQLYDLVMNIHDNAMALMPKVNRVRMTLNGAMLAAKEAGDTELETQIKEQLDIATTASNGMTDWMKGFEHPPASMDNEAAIEYLQKEKTKVVKVQEDINTTIKTGNEYIEKLQSIGQ